MKKEKEKEKDEARLLSPTLKQGPVVRPLQSCRGQRMMKLTKCLAPSQRPRLHHIGLAPPPPRNLRQQQQGRARSEQQQAVEALRQWIAIDCGCDPLLSSLHTGGGGGRALFDPERYCRVRPSDALDFYRRRPDDLPPDMLLCQGVCPVFVLHACAALLRSDADAFHQSQETLVLLHCLKRRLYWQARQQQRTDVTCGFLRRLFELCECEQMQHHNHCLVVVTVFMTSNVDFVRPVDGRPHYKLCVDDLKRPGAIQSLLVDNLLINYDDGTNAWTRLYITLQMDAHCARLEHQWLQYYQCSQHCEARPFAPTPLVLDVPVGGQLADGAALALAIKAHPALAVRYTAVI